MAPSIFPGGCGPTNRDQNILTNSERTINWYPHKQDAGTPKVSEWNLLPTPGLRPYVSLGSGVVRALWSEDRRCFAIAGNQFFEIDGNQTAILWGTVESDGNPATMCSNGRHDGKQLFIVSGGKGYIFKLEFNDLVPIVDTGFTDNEPFSMGAFSSSYFLALKANSNQFQFSALLDGETWSAIDVARTSLTTDNKLALIANHAELWLLGSKRSEVWANTGDASTPFQPIPGTVIEGGTTAVYSAQRIDNTIAWLSGDERGNNMLWMANGYTPTRVSSFSVDASLAGFATTRNSIAWTYQDEGHSFYWLYIPSADTSWVYDVSTGLWHERALWNDRAVRWEPHVGLHHTLFEGKHLVGDRRIGMVYEMAPDQYDDDIALVASP